MCPPYIASAIALAHGNLVGATLALAAVALIAMLLASLRAPSTREDTVDLRERLSRFHIFGPDEDEEPLVHIPVLSTPVAPEAPARPAADVSRALDRVAAFAVRQPHPAAQRTMSAAAAAIPPPSAPAPAAAPAPAQAPPAPAVRWKQLPPLQPAVTTQPAHPLPAAPDLSNARPPAPRTDRKRGELPLDGDILLVEDDIAVAEMYRLLLHTRGYATRHALDGADGIAMVREERPALILLDMMMPRMDGIQFLEALRSWPKTSAIPVVVLANVDTTHLVTRAMDLGAVEYLVKAQTRPQVLARALPHWLRGNRALSAAT